MSKSIVRRSAGRVVAVAAWLLLAAAGTPPGLPGVDSVGGAAWAQTCPAGSQVHEVGQAYRFRRAGHEYLWAIYRKPNQARVGFRHERADGSWSEEGSINRWPKCPAANISVQVIDEGGRTRVCTRVCLSDGREELHCPLARFALARPTPLRLCLDAAASTTEPTPTPTPEPEPRACRFRVGCQTWATCVSCCKGDSFTCGWACELSAGGDVGTDRCADPFPPDDRDDAISCVPVPGYPNWCEREMPAF